MNNTVAIICSKMQNLTWPVQKSQPKAFEVCASIQIHQSATVGSSKPQPCPGQGCLFGSDTLIGGFELTCIPQMPLVETFAPVMLRKVVLQLQDRFSWEILEGLSSHSMEHGYISSGSGAGIFKVRNQIVWRQFQLKLDWVTRRWLIAACLVSFFSSNRCGQIFISQNSAKQHGTKKKTRHKALL